MGALRITRVEDLPKFDGSPKDILNKTIEWIHQNIEIKKWTPEDLGVSKKEYREAFNREFASKSPKDVLERGHTFYLNPCLDLTTIALEILKHNGLNPTFITEEFEHSQKEFGNQLHFALEIPLSKAGEPEEIVTLNFVYNGNAIIYEGRFEEHQLYDHKILKIHRISGDDFSFDSHPFESGFKHKDTEKGTISERSIKIGELFRHYGPDGFKRNIERCLSGSESAFKNKKPSLVWDLKKKLAKPTPLKNLPPGHKRLK